MKIAPGAERRVRREFYPEDYAPAIRMLSGWDTKDSAPGERPSRMHSAVLALALGNLSLLRIRIRDANSDFRDVLLWAEYAVGKNLRCVACPPSESAPDPLEEAFLRSIAANPRDDAPWLIYADWPEERGDRRAEYIRLLCEWIACRPDEGQQMIKRERRLRASLDRRWLARIRGIPVRDANRGR
jgi:uncharacterized protein (TIGR02996 family)